MPEASRKHALQDITPACVQVCAVVVTWSSWQLNSHLLRQLRGA